MSNIKVGDKVSVLDHKGNSLGEGIVVNINDFREPSHMYAIEADFYKGDFVFTSRERLLPVKEED